MALHASLLNFTIWNTLNNLPRVPSMALHASLLNFTIWNTLNNLPSLSPSSGTAAAVSAAWGAARAAEARRGMSAHCILRVRVAVVWQDGGCGGRGAGAGLGSNNFPSLTTI